MNWFLVVTLATQIQGGPAYKEVSRIKVDSNKTCAQLILQQPESSKFTYFCTNVKK